MSRWLPLGETGTLTFVILPLLTVISTCTGPQRVEAESPVYVVVLVEEEPDEEDGDDDGSGGAEDDGVVVGAAGALVEELLAAVAGVLVEVW